VALRGWIVKPRRSSTGERALLAAVVYQALVDANAGDRQAQEWLRTVAPEWCEFIGIDGSRLRTALPKVKRPLPLSAADAVRCRLYRERKRAEQAQGARPDG
jgi:hypothetical protein